MGGAGDPAPAEAARATSGLGIGAGSWRDHPGRGEGEGAAESSGADLAQVLRSAARDTRRSRARQAEERAAHLGVRLVLPTGVALLPAFVVLGIVPTVMSLLGGTLTLTAAGTVTP